MTTTTLGRLTTFAAGLETITLVCAPDSASTCKKCLQVGRAAENQP